MKVMLMVQNMNAGGVQRLVLDEFNELKRLGHEVRLVTFEKDILEQSFLSETPALSANHVFIPYHRMRDIGGLVRTLLFLRQARPDALITHMWFANTVGRIAGVFARVPRIVSFEHSTYDLMKTKQQFFFDRILQRAGTKIVAVSSAVRESLIRHGIRSDSIAVVENGIALARHTNRKSKLSAPNTSAPFLFVGRLVKDKGADVLIDACALAPGVFVSIAGDGPERKALEVRARESGVFNRVNFLGTRFDIPNLMANARALVVPSRREGFGLVIVEARASGLPIIGTRVGAIPNLIEEGVNGLLIPPDNAAALAEAMRRLSDDSFRTSLAEEAPKGIERYSIEKHVQELLALL